MSIYTPAELEYLQSQRIGRVATVNPAGNPHVVPLRFKYNPDADAIDLVGTDIDTSKKWRDARATGRIAFVVDDNNDGKPRGLEVRGTAEIHETGGETLMKNVGPAFIRIIPNHISTWGIESNDYHAVSRKID
jgi:pyridoxamine 5'-phosphate oxidase family protein